MYVGILMGNISIGREVTRVFVCMSLVVTVTLVCIATVLVLPTLVPSRLEA